MEQELEIAGHPYASEVGSQFLDDYYNVLANQPQLAIQFYTHNSSVVRLDCETGQWSFGETLEIIKDMMMSMNIHKVEVKTANFLQSWGGEIILLVTGLVQLKGYPVRKRFAQTILLAPKKDGHFVVSDIFKFICDECDDQYHGTDYSCVDNTQQVDAPYAMAKAATDYFTGEHEAREVEAPAEIRDVHQQAPLEYSAVIYDDTPLEEHIPPPPSSIDIKHDSPHAPPLAPSPLIPEEGPVEEAPKTYASVRRKNDIGHQAIANKVTMGAVESQQSVPVVEKSNETHCVASVPEDEEFILEGAKRAKLEADFEKTLEEPRDIIDGPKRSNWNNNANELFWKICQKKIKMIESIPKREWIGNSIITDIGLELFHRTKKAYTNKQMFDKWKNTRKALKKEEDLSL